MHTMHTYKHTCIHFNSVLLCQGKEEFSPPGSLFTSTEYKNSWKCSEAVIHIPTTVWMMKTHRDKWWNTEHAVAIAASRCLTDWRDQKPHVKLSQPEPHTYHLLIGNTDKNHLFPILSSVQPSGLLMGMKSKHHLCQPEERSSYDFC